MTYTKQQLEQMSDWQLGKSLDVFTGMYCEDAFGKFIPTIDINNWNDIMPLAVEHGISHLRMERGFIATSNYHDYIFKTSTAFADGGGVFVLNESLQRSITCCLILVLQEKQKCQP